MLLDIVTELNKSDIQESSGRKLISGAMIVSCLYKIDVVVAKDAVAEMFSLFTLFPNTEEKRCPELDVLRNFLTKNESLKYTTFYILFITIIIQEVIY